jgi:hypothetical protein
MASERTLPRAPPFIDPPGYARHRPEDEVLPAKPIVGLVFSLRVSGAAAPSAAGDRSAAWTL